MHPRISLAFLAPRAHCWLMVTLSSPGTPRSLSTELLSSSSAPACTGAWGCSSPGAGEAEWIPSVAHPQLGLHSHILSSHVVNPRLPPATALTFSSWQAALLPAALRDLLQRLRLRWGAGQAAPGGARNHAAAGVQTASLCFGGACVSTRCVLVALSISLRLFCRIVFYLIF